MNITLHGYKPNLTQGGLSDYKFPQDHLERSAGVCENSNRGKNVAFSGSLTRVSKTAAVGSCMDKIYSSEAFGKFLTRAHEHNIATSALIALGLAGVLRPATIIALPGKKDKDDKTYAAGHSFASALVGFVASLILTSPLDTALNKLYDDKKDFFGSKKMKEIQKQIDEKELLKKAGTLGEEGKKALQALYNEKATMKTLVKNIPDWIIAIPRSIITIALIPPILKYVFGVEKKKKPDVAAANQTAQAQAPANNQTDKAENMKYANTVAQNSVFKNIMEGGLK